MFIESIVQTEKELNKEKMLTFTQFCDFSRALRKISVFKNSAQTFEAGLNIFL